jgi:type I restriction enzyme S subunit
METLEEKKVGFKKTKMGWIPNDWNLIPLGKLCDNKGKYGIGAPAIEFKENLPTYIRITDIDNNGNYSPEKKVSILDRDWKDFLLKKGDILFVRTGSTTGKSYLYNELDGKLVYAGFLIKFSPNTNKLSPSYLRHFTTSSIYKKWVSIMSVRSGQPGINSNEYSLLPIPIPEINIQKKNSFNFIRLGHFN